jgi:hypothetical protein
LATWVLPGRAEAQYGYGYGYPWWGVPAYQTPSVVNDINARAAAAGQAAYASRPAPVTAPPRTSRDTTFFERYDADTRSSMEQSVARYATRPTSPAPSRPAPSSSRAPSMAAPVVPLSSFFDVSNVLVWPADAPAQGDLGTRRAAADKDAVAVLKEVRASGTASVATATQARISLINYSEPAMRFLQANTTPRIADTVNLFILSLYHSIGQAADLEKTASTKRTTPSTKPAGKP